MVKVGEFDISLDEKRIFLMGECQPIGSRAFEILELLIANRGKLVTKADVFKAVWPNTAVEENNLQVHISALRKVLGTDRHLIRTVPGRGYRLVTSEQHVSPLEERPSSHTVQLPQFNASIVAMVDEIKKIEGALEASPVVTLVGPGGVGKTRLALEYAHNRASLSGDAIYFVSLEAATTLANVLGTLRAALNLCAGGKEFALPDIVGALPSAPLLIILDNCEQVAAESADLCEALTSNHPRVRVLATSREPLRAAREELVWVSPLSIPDGNASSACMLASPAVKLFLARVHAIEPSFPCDEQSVETVTSICRRLDGLPLAIELAATRAASLGLRHLSSELDNPLYAISGGLRTACSRHRTLHASIDWSYSLLTETERSVLQRLAVFAGGFTLEAACTVAAGEDINPQSATEAVLGLHLKSLVRVGEFGAQPTFRLLETVRNYALQRLRERNEEQTVAARHARHLCASFSNLSNRCNQTVSPLERFHRNIDDIRLALDRGASATHCDEVGLLLASLVLPLFLDSALVAECCARAQRALDNYDEMLFAVPAVKARLLLSYATAFTLTSGPIARARANWVEALLLADELGDTEVKAKALWGLWHCALYAGRPYEAQAFAIRYRSASEDDPVSDRRSLAAQMIGLSLHFAGNQVEAKRELELTLSQLEAADRFSRGGTKLHADRPVILAALARVLWFQGEGNRATEIIRTIEDLLESITADADFCFVLAESLIPLAIITGDNQSARRHLARLEERHCLPEFATWRSLAKCYRDHLALEAVETPDCASGYLASIEQLEATGSRAHLGMLFGLLAGQFLRLGLLNDAAKLLTMAIADGDRTGNRWYHSELHRLRAEVSLAALDLRTAEAGFRDAIMLAREHGARWFELRAMSGLTQLQRNQGKIDDTRSQQTVHSMGHGDVALASLLIESR